MSRSFLAAVLALAVMPGEVLAEQFVTEDTDIVNLGYWQLTTGIGANRGREGWSGEAEAELEYGLEENISLHVAVPIAFNLPSEGPSFAGVGDLELGIKYRLIEQTEGSLLPSVALSPVVEIPTGDEVRDLGEGEIQVFLPVWLQYEVDDWEMFGGGGYRVNLGEESRNTWFVGLGATFEVTPDLSLGGEIFYETAAEADARGVAGLRLGGSYQLSARHAVLFSIGRDLDDASEASQFSAFLGWSAVF